MWDTLTWRGLRTAAIAADLEAFREGALRFFLWLMLAGYLAWHTLHTLSITGRTAEHWVLLPVVLAGWTISYLLLRRDTHLAVVSFLCASILTATIAAYTLETPIALVLYPMTALTAVVLLQPVAGLITSVASMTLLLGLWNAGQLPFLHSDRLIETGLASFVAVVVPWSLWRNMVIALQWSLDNQTRAEQNLEEARNHRGQLVQALKQLDNAYFRLERANAALELAWRAAEDAERSKSEFVTNISHELRTPLNLVVGFSDMILSSPQSYGAPLPAPYREDLFAIYRSAQHLRTLTDDVIDLARVGTERLALTREVVDLRETVNDACAIVKEYVSAKGLWLRVEMEAGLPTVQVDQARVRQVLLNLLTNSARFTNHGGITVRARHEAESVVVEVSDTGCGIPTSEVGRIFERFYHHGGEEVGRKARLGGVGLGLPISRHLVELHGGQMTVESIEGQGSTFRFTLPVESTDSPVEQEAWQAGRVAAGVPPAQRMVVLISDDSTIAAFLRRHIRRCQVVVAASKPAAIATASELSADAILADLSSYDPEYASQSRVPVLWLPLPRADSIAAITGATAVLSKPVSLPDLRSAIESLGKQVRTVLVVDDDPGFVKLATRMLRSDVQRPGLRVFSAYSGGEALEVTRACRPDLLLLDLGMPDMDGREVIASLSRDPELASIPVIVVSAQDQTDWQALLHGPVTIESSSGHDLGELMGLVESVVSVLRPPSRRHATDAASEKAPDEGRVATKSEAAAASRAIS